MGDLIIDTDDSGHVVNCSQEFMHEAHRISMERIAAAKQRELDAIREKVLNERS